MIYETSIKEEPYPIKSAMMKGNRPFMNHCHREMEILQVKKGSLKVANENEEILLREGDIWIVPPFASHSIGQSSDDCVRLAILADLRVMGSWEKDQEENLWMQKQLNRLDLNSQHWDPATAEKGKRIIGQLYEEIQKRGHAWKLAVKTLLCELMLTAVREMPLCEKEQPLKELAKLKNVLEYIALHYCSDLTLGGCAEAVGFNSTYLSRYFSSHMGITFQEYVKRLRIDKAKWLLMTEEISITEVCYQSGFHDVKTFNKLFRWECGMNPTEFRKSVRMKERTD